MSPSIHCAQCDYDLKGLQFEGVCPECAHPILETLAAVRTGSPWQREPSAGSWMRTAIQMCSHPIQFWAQVELEFPRTWNLLVINVLIASVLTGSAFGVKINAGRAADPFSGLIGGIFLSIPVFVVLFLVTNLLMAVVRPLAPSAGRMAVRTAIAHASFLWVPAAPVALLTPGLMLTTSVFPLSAVGIIWLGAIGARRLRYAPEPIA